MRILFHNSHRLASVGVLLLLQEVPSQVNVRSLSLGLEKVSSVILSLGVNSIGDH
jgi:hypothetical protein